MYAFLGPIFAANRRVNQTDGGQTDPYWNDVLLYLPMNGSNGSTTFTDVSPSPRTVTVSGNAQISTVQSKYGGASGLFDGGADYLTVNPLTLDAADFTIECWVCPNAITEAAILNQGGADVSGNWCLAVFPSGSVVFYADNYPRLASALTVAVGQWRHIALTRSGNTYRLFVDGALQDTQNYSFNHTGAPFKVGNGYGGISTFVGYIDEVRVTKAARYLGDFNPETHDPYLSDVLLYVSGDGEVGSEAEDSGPLALSQTAVVNPVLIAEPPIPLFAGRKAMRFSGDNGAVFSSPQFLFPQSQDWTLECWVYFDNPTSTDETFFSLIPNPSSGHAFHVKRVTAPRPADPAQGRIGLTYYGSGVGGDPAPSVPAGQWRFIVLEFFEGVGKVWVNGLYDFAISGGNPPAFHLRDIALGLCPGVYDYEPGLNGYLAEVRLTKRARYQGSRDARYHDIPPPVPSGPFG
jgi:hypothetical protein